MKTAVNKRQRLVELMSTQMSNETSAIDLDDMDEQITTFKIILAKIGIAVYSFIIIFCLTHLS